jgi:hypothetical protein
MSYGVFIRGVRPKSKKQVKEAMKATPASVTWQNDSAFGPDAGMTYPGNALPEGLNDTFVGPDPHRSRKFYGQIKVKDGKVTVT